MNIVEDAQIAERKDVNNEFVIEDLFKKHYRFLCATVYKIIPDANVAEDIVQDVFYDFWKKQKQISIKSSAKAYLKRSVVNRSLNYIRKDKQFLEIETSDIVNDSYSIDQNYDALELKDRITLEINRLPKKCRTVFMLSRFDELTYNEIAKALEISVKTVENHISKALKILKKQLKPYLENNNEK